MAAPKQQGFSKKGAAKGVKKLHLPLGLPIMQGFRKDDETVYSPITHLAMNLNELSTCSLPGETPKRKLSLLDTSSDSPNLMFRPVTLEKRLDNDCCSPMDSPSDGFLHKKRSPLEMKSAAYRRFQAMPSPYCDFSPVPSLRSIKSDIRLLSDDNHDLSESTPEKIKSPGDKKTFLLDEVSQDSGLGLEKENDFKAPLAPAPRRYSRAHSEDTNSPAKYSPVKPHSDRPSSSPASMLQFSGNLLQGSPIKLRHSSLTSNEEDDGDDGFLEIFEGESAKDLTPLSGLENLFKAPVLSPRIKETTPARTLPHPFCLDQENARPGSSRRGLFRSPSLPSASRLEKTQSFDVQRRPSYKRSEPCHDDNTPVQFKRARNIRDRGTPEKVALRLHRCHSETEATIKTALNRLENNKCLISDGSRSFCLPTIEGKKQDLTSITPETLAAVINGEFEDVVEKHVIVDARYPYEFESGHIAGAKNLYTRDEIYREFIGSDQHRSTTSSKRTIIIFHCEFSSERGPRLSRFLRNMDREKNRDSYPYLHYPEIYLLDGGYKEFYGQEKELCVPQEYKPMLHTDHADDLKHFRAKSKSWAGLDKTSKKGSRSIFRTTSSFRSGLKL